MTYIYLEDDADLTVLDGKTVAVIGYGTLGRSLALNLRDSGVAVIVGGSVDECARAGEDGFANASPAEATRQATIILLMLPDEIMTQTYMTDISPNLHRGDTLIFGSAYNVAFGFIEPPPFVDVGLVAPRATDEALRERFQNDQGFLSFVALWQDASRSAWQTVLAVALAIGSLKMGAIEVSIEQEAELSLFMQQAIIPAFHNIMLTAAQLMMQQGYPAEAVLLDLYLSGRFSDYTRQIAEAGLLPTLSGTSLTEQYGTISRLDRFNEVKLERLMEVTLEEIRTGGFAREWSREYTDGHPRLNKLLRQHTALDLWELEQQTLDLLRPEDDSPVH
jgi:ketol-acid reductoisomerase